MHPEELRPRKLVWPLQAMPLARAMGLSYALLIVYVSLNPFDFDFSNGLSAWAWLDAPTPRFITLFDVLANILAYIPFGFLIVFAKALELELPKFDFSLDGVTSISIDHHKYGFAPKGVSAIFYKTKELRRYQYFSTTTWPGGLYLTPNAMGSRSGAPIAGAWFAMVYLGYNGYKENANMVFSAVEKIKKGIQKVKELEVIGDPIICVVSFKSVAKWLNIYALDQALHQKGWLLAGVQKPAAIHFGVTVANSKQADDFLVDLDECIEDIRENPKKFKGGKMAAMYGTTSMIPDERTVEDVTKLVCDCMLKI